HKAQNRHCCRLRAYDKGGRNGGTRRAAQEHDKIASLHEARPRAVNHTSRPWSSILRSAGRGEVLAPQRRGRVSARRSQKSVRFCGSAAVTVGSAVIVRAQRDRRRLSFRTLRLREVWAWRKPERSFASSASTSSNGRWDGLTFDQYFDIR